MVHSKFPSCSARQLGNPPQPTIQDTNLTSTLGVGSYSLGFRHDGRWNQQNQNSYSVLFRRLATGLTCWGIRSSHTEVYIVLHATLILVYRISNCPSFNELPLKGVPIASVFDIHSRESNGVLSESFSISNSTYSYISIIYLYIYIYIYIYTVSVSHIYEIWKPIHSSISLKMDAVTTPSSYSFNCGDSRHTQADPQSNWPDQRHDTCRHMGDLHRTRSPRCCVWDRPGKMVMLPAFLHLKQLLKIPSEKGTTFKHCPNPFIDIFHTWHIIWGPNCVLKY